MSTDAFTQVRRLAALPLLLATAMLVLGAWAGSPGRAAAAATAKSPKLTAALSATSANPGVVVKVTGKLTPAGARRVRLEARNGRVWKAISTGTTSRKGAYALAITAPTAGSVVVRVRAPRKGRFAGARSKALTLTVVAPILPPCCKTTTPATTPTPTPSGVAGAPVRTAPSTKSSFRAIYALASDQTADPTASAAITADIAAANGWFATQTSGGVQPRWVRDGTGAVPITTITLPDTAAQYATEAFADVEADIAAAAPTPDNQKSVVWFDTGTPNGACGVTGFGASVLFEAACNIHPKSTDVWPYGGTYLAAHEMTHNFGAVKSCAPHVGGGGHVTDDPRDVLYVGAAARDWTNLTLDPGHDDYYDTGRADCPGIESSPFWTATSDPLS